MVVVDFLQTYWRAAIIGLVMLLLAIGGVQWCRRPPKLVEEVTAPAKAKIDKATEAGLLQIIADRDRDLKAERAKNTKLRQAAEVKVTVPFDAAVKGGTHAMAELATLWTAPGTAEQLRARWRPTADPANPGR